MTFAADRAKYYARMQIETSAKPRIICMLHEKCTQLIRQAIDNGPVISKPALINAQNILAQLERSLNGKDEVSDSLFYLYDYCYCKLENSDQHSLNSALEIISLLSDTFQQLLKPHSQ